MRPVAFYLGTFPVHSYAVMMILGFMAAGFVMQRDFVRKGVPNRGSASDLAWSIVLFGAVGGLLGSRLLAALHNQQSLLVDPWGWMTGEQGMVWYGGLFGGLLATQWPIHRAGVSWSSVFDTAAPALAVGQACGRIGCHLAGDADWGTPTTLPWGMAYTAGVSPWTHAAGVRVHPAPLYEALALLAIFCLLWSLRGAVRRPGALFALYVVVSGVSRFAIEFVRINDEIPLGLTEAQWVGLGLVVVGGVWLALGLRPMARFTVQESGSILGA